MKARLPLLLSLALNFMLAAMVLILSQDSEEQFSRLHLLLGERTNAHKQIRTNVVVRRQHFHWTDVESTDYAEYIRNLRAIGCPERTIRDIIVADVNDLFAQRINREVVLPDQQWWLAEPNMDVFESAANQIRALEEEKNQLLASLLGPNWNSSPQTSAGDPIRLDGAVLSALDPNTKAALFQIEANALKAREAYLTQARENGMEPDPAELARMRQEVRRELAGILNPEQLEEYLLRYSATSQNLREELRGLGADAEEYRRIFRARDHYDQKLALLTGSDSATERQRAELLRQREDAVRQVLAADRYPLYQLTQDPLFEAARNDAEQNGATPEKVIPIFQINQAAEQEIARINAQRELTEEERLAALRLVQEQQQASIRRIIEGSPGPE